MPSLVGAASAAGGAVSELFAASASRTKAQMYRIESEGDLLKGEGAKIEGENYGRAHDLAELNKTYTEQSTAIQTAQAYRALYQTQGQIRASAGGSGIRESGSVLDVLSDSASQGELHKQIISQQGLITEAGYQEQADVYTNMVKASKIAVHGAELASQEHLLAAEGEETAAKGHDISAVIKGVTAVASLFTGGGGGGGGGGGDAFVPSASFLDHGFGF